MRGIKGDPPYHFWGPLNRSVWTKKEKKNQRGGGGGKGHNKKKGNGKEGKEE